MTITHRPSRRRKNARPADPAEYTPFYAYRAAGRDARGKKTLYCDGVSLDEIADAVATPAYVYSARSIADAYRRLDRALGRLPHTICYAVKSNGNLQVLRLFAWRNFGPGWRRVAAPYTVVVDDPAHIRGLVATGRWRRVRAGAQIAVAERIKSAR